MKAAFVVDKDKVEIRDVPKPSAAPGEILVKVRCVGVCGSDLHLYKGHHAFRRPPAILGHEFSGEVAEVGAGVVNFKVGDRVTGNPVVTCGKCHPCRIGRTGICSDKRVPGTPAWIGTFAEYFPIPANLSYKLSDKVGFAEAVLAEPMAVSQHILRRVVESPRQSLAILGCGSIGLLAMFLARRESYRKIFCSDPSSASRELALKLGADAAFDPMEKDFEQKILALTDNPGVDVTIIAAGGDDILDQASTITRKGGDVVLVSMITKTIPVNSYSYVFKEQRLNRSMVYDVADFDTAVKIINDGAEMFAFVTQRFPLEKTQEAMMTLDRKEKGIIKVIVDVA